jgi:DNA-binding transcriptional MerR regulator
MFMGGSYFTLADVVRTLRTQPHIVTYMLRTGRIPEPMRVGGRRLFTMEDVSRIEAIFLRNSEQEPEGEAGELA